MQKYNKTVYSRTSLDNYWQWFTKHGTMNIKRTGWVSEKSPVMWLAFISPARGHCWC